jgi:hypothetical protein
MIPESFVSLVNERIQHNPKVPTCTPPTGSIRESYVSLVDERIEPNPKPPSCMYRPHRATVMAAGRARGGAGGRSWEASLFTHRPDLEVSSFIVGRL